MGLGAKKKEKKDALHVYCLMQLVNLAVDAAKNSSQWHLLIKSTDRNRNNLKQS